jgi:uncharacterized protein (DUF427 family)
MAGPAPGFEKHPDYRVEIEPTGDRIRILVEGEAVADTRSPLKVVESRHHPVWYLPLADVDPALIESTAHTTYCPFKGTASYWTIHSGATTLENSIWSYRDPFDECEPLKDHVAFYTDRVTLEVNGEVQRSQGPGWSE